MASDRPRTPRRRGRGGKGTALGADPNGRLVPPPGGAVIRMYRIGHGDCFLLAFTGRDGRAVYVLIDCGYKPGSPSKINNGVSDVTQITNSIRAATGGHIDVAVITHEHQDHVNGISEDTFRDITIGETWFAWTEDPDDALAGRLRQRFKDKLVGLIAVRDKVASLAPHAMGVDAAGNDRAKAKVALIDDFLAFELGGTDEQDHIDGMRGLLGVAGESANKRSMKVFKDKASKIRFLGPHEAFPLPGTEDVRVYVLGPPRDEDLLHSLDPEGDESFRAFGARSSSSYLAAAAAASDSSEKRSPFAARFAVPWSDAFHGTSHHGFFVNHYGQGEDAPMTSSAAVPNSASWRRIDTDWLEASEHLALDLNNDTNNASLVLAFELGEGGKVLLFAGDAQRGNWISWSQKDWPARTGSERISARDLLARTTHYKVGHHGSHNATLNGLAKDDYANLSWMGSAADAGEFTAMITAVRAWAITQKGWDHPQKEIKEALIKKAGGRVLQTDTALLDMPAPGGQARDWNAFLSRTIGDRLYFDIVIPGRP